MIVSSFILGMSFKSSIWRMGQPLPMYINASRFSWMEARNACVKEKQMVHFWQPYLYLNAARKIQVGKFTAALSSSNGLQSSTSEVNAVCQTQIGKTHTMSNTFHCQSHKRERELGKEYCLVLVSDKLIFTWSWVESWHHWLCSRKGWDRIDHYSWQQYSREPHPMSTQNNVWKKEREREREKERKKGREREREWEKEREWETEWESERESEREIKRERERER